MPQFRYRRPPKAGVADLAGRVYWAPCDARRAGAAVTPFYLRLDRSRYFKSLQKSLFTLHDDGKVLWSSVAYSRAASLAGLLTGSVMHHGLRGDLCDR
jgi:hypothetical protein